jgi:signal transduction histidine kinase
MEPDARRVKRSPTTTHTARSAAPGEAGKAAPGHIRRGVDEQPAGVTAGERDVRKRLVSAEDTARKQIERDLHDGAQQRLTDLAIQLGIAADAFRERGNDEVSLVLDGFGKQLQGAIDELRELAHGIYPPLLSHQGLIPALRAAGRHTGQSVRVRAGDVGRYPQEVESAVYFSCVAAIHNAVKHAGPAEIAVHVWKTAGTLRFSVSDTGRGFDPQMTRSGAGITNIRDRLTAVGGSLTIASAPSQGTQVLGAIPLGSPASEGSAEEPASSGSMLRGS